MGGAAGIVMYMTGWCPYCARARSLLDHHDVPYTLIDVEETEGARAEMQQRSGRRTVPQIFIGDRHIGGCDDLHALDAAGELAPLLKGAARA